MNKAYIKDLLALINILDQFGEFKRDIEDLINSKYNRDLLNELYSISIGNNLLGKFKLKKFYQTHKEVIDKINKYVSISNFIMNNYDTNGNMYPDSSLNYFYHYFLEYKTELPKILQVLIKLDLLGFRTLTLNENLDFTLNTYYFSSSYPELNYLENMEVMPNYQSEVIKYRTTGSPYWIKITDDCFCYSYDMEITLNSLIFDIEKLPSSLDYEYLVNNLTAMAALEQKSKETLIQSVDLSISLLELENAYQALNTALTNLPNDEYANEMRNNLIIIKKALAKLKGQNKIYESYLINTNPNLKATDLENERNRCLSIRRSIE